MLDEMNAIHYHWGLPQPPVKKAREMNLSFRALLAAVEQGWQIEEPVQVLPSTTTETWTYYFLLTHPSLSWAKRLFVPALPDVQRYVDQNGLQVIEGMFY